MKKSKQHIKLSFSEISSPSSDFNKQGIDNLHSTMPQIHSKSRSKLFKTPGSHSILMI